MRNDMAAEMVESVKKVVGDESQATRVVRQLLADFGGTQVYLPMVATAFRDELEAEVYDSFDGSNQREICTRYQISFTTLYAIIKREREKRIGKREEDAQGVLDLTD